MAVRDPHTARAIVAELATRGCVVHSVATEDVGGHVHWFLDPCDERAVPAYRTGTVVLVGVEKECVERLAPHAHIVESLGSLPSCD